MCDIRYFKSAYHCYDVAANLMRFYKSDEMYLNDVAYNLQQCVEKTLKAFLECKGVTIPPTHSIRKLIAMSRNQGSVVIITDRIEKNRIETGLREVKLFLERNHMGHLLNPDLTDKQKTSLRKLLPRDLEIRDDFEWNCYYNIFKKKLADTADTADLV